MMPNLSKAKSELTYCAFAYADQYPKYVAKTLDKIISDVEYLQAWIKKHDGRELKDDVR